MRLRNKKTREILDKIETIAYIQWSKKIMMVYINSDGERIMKQYDSLETFNAEWEDYEEPKGYWYINEFGTPTEITTNRENIYDKQRKNFGNYFKTEEEAEKAVEKLKAWKRLKEKGFRFDVMPALGHCDDEKFDISIIAIMPAKWWYNDKVVDDIHYVFGGEE